MCSSRPAAASLPAWTRQAGAGSWPASAISASSSSCVDAGLSPEAAIKVATSNGAAFLRARDFGTVAAGMRADLVVLQGNPSQRISDVRNVEMVFKDGVAYDPAALLSATNGTVSQYDAGRLFRSPLLNAIFVSLVLALLAKVSWRLWRRRRDTGET